LPGGMSTCFQPAACSRACLPTYLVLAPLVKFIPQFPPKSAKVFALAPPLEIGAPPLPLTTMATATLANVPSPEIIFTHSAIGIVSSIRRRGPASSVPARIDAREIARPTHPTQ